MPELTPKQLKKLKQEYETPPEFWAVIAKEFGPTRDVAASAMNTKCSRHIGVAVDSLSPEINWLDDYWPDEMHQYRCGVAWCNPPFANMMPWVLKAYAEAQRVPNGCVLVLGPNSAAKWMGFCMKYASEIRILTPRIQFIPAPGVTTSTNMSDNALVVFRKRLTTQPAHMFLWDWTNEPKPIGENHG